MSWEDPFGSSVRRDVANKPYSVSVRDEIIFFVHTVYLRFVRFLTF